MNELEHVQAQKAELEKKEQELKATVRKKLEQQTERLNKLGVTPKGPKRDQTRDEKIPAPYLLCRTGDRGGLKKDADEVVVLLLTQLAPGTCREFATADRDLASKLAWQLPEQAKEGLKDKKLKLRVIKPIEVDKFKMANPQWKSMSAGDIGQKLGADFVLDICLDKMRLYQPGSLNQIYEGRAEVSVSIYEIGTKGGELKDKYQLPFAYPRTGIRDPGAIGESQFRTMFMDNLTSEIIRQHVDSAPSRDDEQTTEPDRIGRIVIEGNTRTPDKTILDALALRPGQVLQHPRLEDARSKLQKVGFRSVSVEVVPAELDDCVFKDIRVRVEEQEPKSVAPLPELALPK